MQKTYIFFILFITGLLQLSASIKPEQTSWGFDGRVQFNRLNPVAILFSNPSPEAFEGAIMLQRTDGLGKKVGSPQVQPVFLGPYAFRWVQFYPFIRRENENFICFWGRGSDYSFSLKSPKKGNPSVVFFASPNSSISQKKLRIKPFPEHLFPPSVSLTHGLRAVVIEETPEFTPVQSEAFFNWVYGGGKLFLMPDHKGEYPKFQGKCNLFNFPEQEIQLGKGSVKKLPQNLKFISPSSIGLPRLKQKKIEDKKDNFSMNNIDYRIDAVTNNLFRKLRYDVKTNHNWGLIAFVTIIYLILIVVVNYIIARKTRKITVPLIFFACTVLFFSLLFALIGRRGYDEKSQLTSVGYAKDLGNGNFDVAQWMNIFVTAGDYYRISHPAKTNFYSTCQTMEAVNGVISNGIKGNFYVDIPLFSSKSVYHRGMFFQPTAKIEDAVFSLTPDGTLDKVSIQLNEKFPGTINNIYGVYNGYFYDLVFNYKDKKIDRVGFHKDLKKYFEEYGESNFYPNMYYTKEKSFTDEVKKMVPSLILRDIPKDDGNFYLYILASTPKNFKAIGDKIKTEKGFTLYHFKLKDKQ